MEGLEKGDKGEGADADKVNRWVRNGDNQEMHDQKKMDWKQTRPPYLSRTVLQADTKNAWTPGEGISREEANSQKTKGTGSS